MTVSTETNIPNPSAMVLASFFPKGHPENPFAGLSDMFQPIAQLMWDERPTTSASDLILLAQMIQSAHRMHQAAHPDLSAPTETEDFDPNNSKDAERRLRHAQHDYRSSLSLLIRVESHKVRLSKLAPEPPKKPEIPAPPPRPYETDEEIQHAYENWGDRIALVPAFDEELPVILRTGLAVDFVMMLNNGKEFSDDEVLYIYPELWRTELAACQACQEAGCNGPFDFWNPRSPDIRVIEGAEGEALAAYFRTVPRTKLNFFPLGKPENLSREAAEYHANNPPIPKPTHAEPDTPTENLERIP